MKRTFKSILYVVAAAIVIVLILISGLLIVFPRVGPPQDLRVEITAEKVERGEYLAYHVMMCADCHSKRDFTTLSGPPHPGTEFTGGEIFDQSMGFPGRFVSSNITPFGVGDWTDGELFRLITEGVTKDGNAIFPVMPYHLFGQLAGEDVEAVIAYLRTLDPVETDHPKSKADFPFNLILRTMPKKAELTEKPDTADRIAYGRYVFTAAACADCHTNFEKGEFVGPTGGGGREFQFPDGAIVRSANLTPHETGIGRYAKEEFINLFKRYADSSYVLPHVEPGNFQTLMPWAMYAGMKESDLGAIYEYLGTLEAYDNPIELFTPAGGE